MIFRILFLWMMILLCGQSLADFIPSPEAGIGEWHELPFGKMRLVSCSSGVDDLSMVVGGLEVNLNADWTMKKPSLKPLSTDLPSWIESPVVAGSGKDVTYQGNLFFPLVYARNPTEKNDFEFGVQGDFPLCRNGKCLTFPLRLSLPLSAREAKYTSLCSYIIKKQHFTPLPASIQGIIGTATTKGENIYFTFSGIRRPEIAFLQTTTEEDFQVLTTQLEETGLSMYVQTKPWAVGSSKEWILLTNKGYFRVPVVMEKEAKPLPSPSAPWSIWWMGWSLFFMTPLFVWWGLGIARTKKLWQKQIIRLCLFLPLALIGKIAWQQFVPFDIILFNILLLALVCFIPPQKYLWALALFVIWPLTTKIPDLSPSLFALWFVVIWIEVGLPFAYLYLKADEFGSLLRRAKKQNFFRFNLAFLTPTLFLLGLFIWRSTRPMIPYQNTINPSGLTIVCQNCAPWKSLSNVHFVHPDTPFGKALKNIYHRPKNDLIFWQEKGIRVILPPHTDFKTVKSFLINWQKYHAVDTPLHQPVHFPDDRHDL